MSYGTPPGASDLKVLTSSPRAALFAVVGSLLCLALGYWMFNAPGASRRWDPAYVQFVGGIAIAFGLVTLVVWLYRLLRPRPGLILCSDGISLPTGRAGWLFLAWADLAGMSVVEIARIELVVFQLVDADAHLRRLSGIMRAVAEKNIRICGSPVSIAPHLVGYNAENLTLLVSAYRSKHVDTPRVDLGYHEFRAIR